MPTGVPKIPRFDGYLVRVRQTFFPPITAAETRFGQRRPMQRENQHARHIGGVPPLNAASQMAAFAYLARQLGTDPTPVLCGTLTLQTRQVCSALRCVGYGSSNTAAVSAGWKKPSPIALQVMPRSRHFRAMARVSCGTPPMPAPWGALPSYARQRCSDALWTTRPQPRAFTRGGGAWVITDRAPPGKYTSSRSSLLPDPTRSMGNRCP